MVDQAKRYVDTLPAPDANHNIMLQTEHTYSLDIEPFIRHGSAHCRCFCILRDKNDNGGFIGYPANFFDDLVKVDYDDHFVRYTLRNKHRPEVDFYFDVHFDGNAKCYKRMTTFSMWMEKNDFGLLQEK